MFAESKHLKVCQIKQEKSTTADSYRERQLAVKSAEFPN